MLPNNKLTAKKNCPASTGSVGAADAGGAPPLLAGGALPLLLQGEERRDEMLVLFLFLLLLGFYNRSALCHPGDNRL